MWKGRPLHTHSHIHQTCHFLSFCILHIIKSSTFVRKLQVTQIYIITWRNLTVPQTFPPAKCPVSGFWEVLHWFYRSIEKVGQEWTLLKYCVQTEVLLYIHWDVCFVGVGVFELIALFRLCKCTHINEHIYTIIELHYKVKRFHWNGYTSEVVASSFTIFVCTKVCAFLSLHTQPLLHRWACVCDWKASVFFSDSHISNSKSWHEN